MPTVNPYANKRGLFIRAAHQGRIATYQVTAEGEEELRQSGLGGGGEISSRSLREMKYRGLVYTGGGGMGDQDRSSSGPTAVATREELRRYSAPGARHSTQRQPRESDTTPALGSVKYCAPAPSGDGAQTAGLLIAGVVGLGGLILVTVFLVPLLFWTMLFWIVLSFLPFGLMGGFLARCKGRHIAEGFYWGQVAGPVGLIFVTFLEAVEEDQPPGINHIEPERDASGDALKVVVWCLIWIAILTCLFAIIILFGKNASG